MTRHSLRLRLIAGGAIAIVVALAVAGVGLILLFERHIERTLAEDLDVHLKQLIAGIETDTEGRIVIARPPADPRFAEPLSGLYWQVSADGTLLRSRSLWDSSLSLPADGPSADVHRHELSGPGDTRVLAAERWITLTIGGKPTPVGVAVATDLARVATTRNAFATDLVTALAILALVLALATSTQVSLGLRPLDMLRRGIAEISAGRSQQLAAAVPDEVKPLVDEVNALLQVRQQDIERSRNRAADLAHGLKTPLAALASDADRLRSKGEISIADEIDGVIDTMRRHVDRELARARLRHRIGSGASVATAVAPLVRSLVATVSRTDCGARIAYEVSIPDTLTVPLDRTDMAEVLGNLLENATKHAKSRVRIAASEAFGQICLTVEDDGPGISPDRRASALTRGVRLDERAGSAGLGLAIVQDVLEAYDWTLSLDTSPLGGLKASCCSPRRADH